MEINNTGSTYGAAFRQKPIFFMSGKETVAFFEGKLKKNMTLKQNGRLTAFIYEHGYPACIFWNACTDDLAVRQFLELIGYLQKLQIMMHAGWNIQSAKNLSRRFRNW